MINYRNSRTSLAVLLFLPALMYAERLPSFDEHSLFEFLITLLGLPLTLILCLLILLVQLLISIRKAPGKPRQFFKNGWKILLISAITSVITLFICSLIIEG